MHEIELLVVSKTEGLGVALAGYTGWRLISGPTLGIALNMLSSSRPPQAIYVEDGCGTRDELWGIVHTAIQRGVQLYVGVHGVGLTHLDAFQDSGTRVTTASDPLQIAAWLAAELPVRRRTGASRQRVITIAGAKGGIGKTTAAAMLAEGFKRRGLRVLVVDGDISNSGLVSMFRIPSGFPSYMELLDDGMGAWTSENVRRCVYHDKASGLDFLLGSEVATDLLDPELYQWLALMQVVYELEEYDVVIVDTAPELKRRPYAIMEAKRGGVIILPTPPLRLDREGVANALTAFAYDQVIDRCLLLYMEPEKGAVVSVDQVRPIFARTFPQAQELGVLPRAPRQVSRSQEHSRYVCPLDIEPHSRFSRAVHALVDRLCAALEITPPRPQPLSSLWQRVRARWRSEEYFQTAIRLADSQADVQPGISHLISTSVCAEAVPPPGPQQLPTCTCRSESQTNGAPEIVQLGPAAVVDGARCAPAEVGHVERIT